jgi:tRNA threonylcarbamoyladenosine biosynthesis protein TsaE
MSGVWERRSRAPGETGAIGRAIGGMLRGGDFLALMGPMGAGKTHLLKGVAAGLGVPADEPVVSPTFVLIREYVGRLKLYHIDAYRLSGTAEMLSLGLDELIVELGAVVAVEWADRVADAVPPHACWIELAHRGRVVRDIRVRWNEPVRVTELQAAFERESRDAAETRPNPG